MAVFVLMPAGRSVHAAEKKCKISRVIELPITMNSLRPTIPVKINGKDAKFLLDSGAFYSIMSSATAAEYGLKLAPTPFGYRITGVGGAAGVDLTTVKEFTIAGIPLKNLEFLVGGSEVGGLLGQNFLEKFDVEYDFANGAIRLFHTQDCDNTLLAYWLKPGQNYSAMHIDPIDPAHPYTVGVAYLNGKSVRVAFDTGAFTSVLSDRAAARAGVKTDSPGVVEAGYSRGVGRAQVKTYLARFESFRIGDSEEIKNAMLRFAELDIPFADMLLGSDFFISHRIFVANREHRVYLSYNGGPVFNLAKNGGTAKADSGAAKADAGTAKPDAANTDAGTSPAQGPAPQAPTASASSTPTTPATAAPASAAPASETAETGTLAAKTPAATEDAAVIARRGSAAAARRDFASALLDLTKAVELKPDEPEYYFERAKAYWGNGQTDLAIADFDRAIELKSDFLPAYLLRAELHLQKKDKSAAMADQATVDRLAAPQADLRFVLAELYGREEEYAQVIAQYDLWIKNHPDDSRMVNALGGRCLASALQNQDLDGGRKDCDRAIRLADKHNPANANLYANRGLMLLREGDYRKAIEDFDANLKIQPQNARALYGRGVAEARLNRRADSERDIAAAEGLAPKIAERFGQLGFGP